MIVRLTPLLTLLPLPAVAQALQSETLAWRPYVLGVAWCAGLALVGYAFLRPRRTRH